jgi:hypothetical protein
VSLEGLQALGTTVRTARTIDSAYGHCGVYSQISPFGRSGPLYRYSTVRTTLVTLFAVLLLVAYRYLTLFVLFCPSSVHQSHTVNLDSLWNWIEIGLDSLRYFPWTVLLWLALGSD